MTTYVALLRGVNLGARNKVSMPELTRLVESLGHEDVRTYVQSGNVVFSSTDGTPATVAAALEERIARELGVGAAVLLRTSAELRQIVSENPFARDEDDPTKLLVVFLEKAPSADARNRLDPERSSPDRFSLHEREIYLHVPNGFGRSKLALDYFERRLGVRGTARNWRTVKQLLELAE